MTPGSWIVSGKAMLATHVVGAGDPVIFLHAGVCDKRMWQHQLDHLSADYKAIAYDRRGFGETRADNEDFSAVDDLMAVVDAVSEGKPSVLVGASAGGRIAIDAALRYPSHFRALALITPNVAGATEPLYPVEIKGLMAQLKGAEKAGDVDLINALKAHTLLDGPLQPEGRVQGALRQLFLDMNGIALRSPATGLNLDNAPAFHRLGEISVPTLLMWGSFDYPHIQDRCRELARKLIKGTSHELIGSAHLPSLEQPTLVNDLLANFIKQCSRQRADRAVP